MKQKSLKLIEELEKKYLNKFYYFLKFSEDEMLKGFDTKEQIKQDWIKHYSSSISNFSTGAERIVYALFNGKGVGQPNSAPVGSDLFFEVDDAYIHIDLKTVQTRNISDYTHNIFIGKNQNSYSAEIKKANGQSFSPKNYYLPALPTYYNKNKKNEKICLSYFITILYEDKNLNILVISILSMPNGLLEKHYKSRPLQAGKTRDQARFNFLEIENFELLKDKSKRVKVVYFDKNMKKKYVEKLKFYKDTYKEENNEII